MPARAMDVLRKEKRRQGRKEQMPSRTCFKSPVAVSFFLASEWTMPIKMFFPDNREVAGEEDPFLPSSSCPSLCQDGMFGAAGNHFATMRQKPKIRIYS